MKSRLDLISASLSVAVAAMAIALTPRATPARAQGGNPGPGPQMGGGEADESENPRGSRGDASGSGSRANDGPSGGGLGQGGSPGSPERSTFPALGASGTSGFDNVPGNQGSPLGGRLGPTGLRAPAASLQPPTSGKGQGPGSENNRRLQPPEADPSQRPQLQRLQRLEIPPGPEDPGPPEGLTLDAAIDMLLGRNLELMALKFEIPKAEADILTAGLRSNPIFYADTQFVPYGGFSDRRPGGPLQYDVNVTYPLDVSHKRKARKAVAEGARRVVEAQFLDAVRTRVDDLYTAYVNVLSARENARYGRAYLDGISRVFERAKGTQKDEESHDDAVDMLSEEVRQAQFQAHQAARLQVRATRALALMLDLPPAGAHTLQLRALLRDLRDPPGTTDSLVAHALAVRPDLAAYRLGVRRAQADVRLATANRLADVYVLYQPYTFQDNRPEGLQSPHSWALGVNVPLPLYNRNQGNIQRARVNAKQTAVELVALERQVVYDVHEAVEEFELTRLAVLELERQVLPASRRARDDAYRGFQKDQKEVNEYIDKQRDHVDNVREYRDALVEHRRSMLRLNTTVAARLLP